jgi:NADPH:quinone reductase-like Zn-dependent oxidoreductase
MIYKSVVVTRRGGPEVMQIVENELRAPAPGEARIKVLATSVGRTDVSYRYGRSPFSPRTPFVPGYEIVGRIEALGEPRPGAGAGGPDLNVGDQVAALTGQGGYAEVIYLGQEHLVRLPDSLAPEEVALAVLNYVTAYQMLHRVARVKAGGRALVIGASGGVGTALLQLGRLAGLKLYGTASAGKHALLAGYGAVPIDYHTQDFVAALRQAEPAGLDYVFDGMGGDYGERGLAVLRRGGKLVGYAPPSGVAALLLQLVRLAWTNLLPNGKSAAFYGISALYMRDREPFMQDLPVLLRLLQAGQIKPVVGARYPLLEAARANALLESGQVAGNIALLAPELLPV